MIPVFFRRRCTRTRHFLLKLEPLDDRALPSAAPAIFAVGADAGAVPTVQVYDSAGDRIRAIAAYEASFTGGVRVAVGDLDGDGREEIVTAAGAGGGPHVKVFKGGSYHEMRGFLAFDPSFLGGVYVGAGRS